MTNLILVGPAGSGKTTLTKALGEWMTKEGFSVSYLNLDPGTQFVPYSASFDVRELVTVQELMEKEGLGSNGALIKASEIIEEKMDLILKRIEGTASDFTIIDTPGQMELFLFRRLGPILASGLKGRIASIFTIDPGLLRNHSDFAVLKLMGLVVELRLGVPSIEVINKTDLYGTKRFNELEADFYAGKFSPAGLSEELASRLCAAIETLGKRKRVIAVSGKKGTGMEDLYKSLGELFCSCGDLT